MFQFTTTTVINSAEKSSGVSLFTGDNNILKVKGVGNFKKDNVKALYKAQGTAATRGNVKVVIPTTTGKYRIRLNIGLSQGDNDSVYATDGYFTNLPILIPFEGNTTAATVKKMIERNHLNFKGDKIFNVKASGQELTLEAVNGYLRFSCVVEQEVKVTGEPSTFAVDTAVVPTITLGKEGFADYEYILHNLRIPTSANTDFKAPNYEEAPIPGSLYTQYTLHMCVNRGSLGMNAVGQQVASHTTHVFYVHSSVVTAFETALKTAFGMTTVADNSTVTEEDHE